MDYSLFEEITSSKTIFESDDANVGKSYGMVWVDVESNPSAGCGWGTDFTKNCKFLTDLIKALKAHGLEVGIYASYYQWEDIFGSVTKCPEIAPLAPKLWYAHYDNLKSFSDFKAFGGWKTPTIKQF